MAIVTLYRGIEYRSRLEAKWAAFFHELGWDFTYEPFDGNGYTPDFLVHGDAPMLVEVKPAVTQADYEAPIEKMEKGVKSKGLAMLIVGVSPFMWRATRNYLEYSPDARYDHGVGLLYDPGWWWRGASWNMWDDASLTKTRLPITVCHSTKNAIRYPTGIRTEDDFETFGITDAIEAYLETAWSTATNNVKWRGRAA